MEVIPGNLLVTKILPGITWKEKAQQLIKTKHRIKVIPGNLLFTRKLPSITWKSQTKQVINTSTI